MLRRWKNIEFLIFFGLVLYLWFLFFQISLTEMLISMNKVIKIHHFMSFSASSFNEARHFKDCFLCYVNQSSWKLSICKCVIISITVRATELYHIPNTKLKLMLCAFHPYIKLDFDFCDVYRIFPERIKIFIHLITHWSLSILSSNWEKLIWEWFTFFVQRKERKEQWTIRHKWW